MNHDSSGNIFLIRGQERLLLSFLESVPVVPAKLRAPNTANEKFEDVVKPAQDAAVQIFLHNTLFFFASLHHSQTIRIRESKY